MHGAMSSVFTSVDQIKCVELNMPVLQSPKSKFYCCYRWGNSGMNASQQWVLKVMDLKVLIYFSQCKKITRCLVLGLGIKKEVLHVFLKVNMNLRTIETTATILHSATNDRLLLNETYNFCIKSNFFVIVLC